MTASPARSKAALAVFALGAAAWLCAYSLLAPPFGGVDVFIFKDAGANLAMGHGFTAIPAPFFDGDPAVKLFSSYTPLYPLAYGGWAAMFGVGPYANAYFDLCLAGIAMALSLCLVLPSVAGRAARMSLALTAAISLPAGGIFATTDRPEIFAYAASLLLIGAWIRAPRFRRSALPHGAASIVFLAHPFAGILLLVIFSYLSLVDMAGESAGYALADRFRTTLTGWLAFLGVLFAAGEIFLQMDHDALQRFAQHALGSTSGAGVMRKINGFGDLLPFYTANWRHAFLGASIASLTMAGSLVACFAVFAPVAVLMVARPLGRKETRGRVLLACFIAALFLLPVLVFPRQNNYYSYVRALVPAVILASRSEAGDFLRARRMPAILLIIGWLFCLPNVLINVITREQNLDSYREAAARAPVIMRAIPERDIAAVSPELYFLIKPLHLGMVGIDYVNAGSSASIDALVVTHSGLPSGQIRAPIREELRGAAWQVLTPEHVPVTIRLRGKPIMRSQWGWSFDVFVKEAGDAPGQGASAD